MKYQPDLSQYLEVICSIEGHELLIVCDYYTKFVKRNGRNSSGFNILKGIFSEQGIPEKLVITMDHIIHHCQSNSLLDPGDMNTLHPVPTIKNQMDL